MNIGLFAVINARRYPDRTAITFNERSMTFKEYNERVNRTVHALRSLGNKPGDRVAFLSDICFQYAEMFLAVAKGGFVIVPLNHRLTPSEIAYLVNDSGAQTLVVSSAFIEKIRPILSQLSTVRNVLSLGEVVEGFEHYDDLVQRCPVDEIDIVGRDDDAVWFIYTSGTTGPPKAVVLTHKGICTSSGISVLGYGGLDREDIGLLAAPPYSLGFPNPLLVHWYVGSSVVLLERFDALKALNAIQEYRISVMLVVPTMLKMMISHAEFFGFDMSSLRTIYYMGAPASEALKVQLRNAFHDRVVQGYGQTEASGPLTLLSKSDHRLPDKLGSVGRPFPMIDMRIVDDQGDDVPTGESGEVVYRGDVLMKGYWNSPQATSDSIRDGWLYSGDIGKCDQDGYLYLVGRKKDMVVTGGINVNPSEIEDVINAYPGVNGSAVVGIPDEHWGELLKAVVVLENGSSAIESDIINFCKARLAAFKVPKAVVFVAELPKNTAGKVLKFVLRDQYR